MWAFRLFTRPDALRPIDVPNWLVDVVGREKIKERVLPILRDGQAHCFYPLALQRIKIDFVEHPIETTSCVFYYHLYKGNKPLGDPVEDWISPRAVLDGALVSSKGENSQIAGVKTLSNFGWHFSARSKEEKKATQDDYKRVVNRINRLLRREKVGVLDDQGVEQPVTSSSYVQLSGQVIS